MTGAPSRTRVSSQVPSSSSSTRWTWVAAGQQPVALLQRAPVGREVAHVAGIERNHGAVQERPAFGGRTADDVQVLACEGRHMKVPEKFIERSGLAVDQQLFVGPGNADLQGARTTAPCSTIPLDETFVLAVADALARICRAEALAVPEQVDRFEEVRLTLAVASDEDVGAGERTPSARRVDCDTETPGA